MPRPHRGMKNVQIPFGICTYSSGNRNEITKKSGN